MMHEWACCCDEAVNHHLPIAVAIWIIQIDSVDESSSLVQNLMQISLLYLLSHFECEGHTTESTTPHWLVQWSHHCSHTCMPVHPPWLPGYINVVQTILIILTMAGLFWTDLVYFFFDLSHTFLFVCLMIDLLFKTGYLNLIRRELWISCFPSPLEFADFVIVFVVLIVIGCICANDQTEV